MPRIPNRSMAYGHRPFEGGRGVSLYLGIGPESGEDPGPESIKFRSLRVMPSCRKDRYKRGPAFVRGSGFDFGNGVRKTSAVAVVKDPVDSIDFPLPPELAERVVWMQICVHDQHVENRTNYRPIRLNLDEELENTNTILGTGRLMSIEKRDGGKVLFRFVYDRARDGIQPTQFVATKISGAGTIADVAVNYQGTSPLYPYGIREYQLETPALQDGENYVYQILAKNGSVTKALVGNAGGGDPDIEFTADAAGPPAPTLSITAN